MCLSCSLKFARSVIMTSYFFKKVCITEFSLTHITTFGLQQVFIVFSSIFILILFHLIYTFFRKLVKLKIRSATPQYCLTWLIKYTHNKNKCRNSFYGCEWFNKMNIQYQPKHIVKLSSVVNNCEIPSLFILLVRHIMLNSLWTHTIFQQGCLYNVNNICFGHVGQHVWSVE